MFKYDPKHELLNQNIVSKLVNEFAIDNYENFKFQISNT